MSHVLPKRLAGVIASVVAFAIIAPSTLLSVKADNNDKVQLGSFEYATADNLGGANAFAVFAKNYTDSTSDMEGVIAVDNVTFGEKDFGASSQVTKYIVEGYNLNYIGSSIAGKMSNIRPAEAFIFPDSVTITTGSGAPNNGNGVRLSYGDTVKEFNGINDVISSSDPAKIVNVSNTTFNINFDEAFTALKTYSSNAYNSVNTVSDLVVNDTQINVVCKNGLNVVNLDSSDLTSKSLNIIGESTDYSLIININNLSGDITLDSILTIDGQGYKDYDKVGGKILWNFGPDYSGTATFKSDSMGVILAPSGSIVIGGTSHNGSVFAYSVNNTNCEIHQNPFQGSPVNPNIFTPTDTPAVDTPAVDTPAVDTPAGDTPAVDTPAVDTPAVDTPAVDTPAVDTPAVDTPAVDTPAVDTPAVDTPAVDTPAVDTPAVDTPAVDTPAVDTPAVDTPAVDTPAVDTPAVDTPAVDTPAVDTPAVDTPAVDTPAVDTPAVDTPAVDTPVVDTPAANTPAANTPAANTPAANTPAANTPAANTPAANTPAANTPAANTPAANTPAANTPAANAPAANTPVANTPAANTPAANTPAANTPAANTPAANTPAANTPAVNTPSVSTPVTTTLTISKQDMTGTTGAELDGAQMILTAVSNSSLRYLKVSGGKVGATVTQTAKTISWTSGNTPFVIEELPDGTYTLEETVAPDGYDVITTTQFTITGGNISKTTSNTDVKVENNASGCYVTAFDEALTQPSTTTTTNTVGVEISKQDIAGNEIANATLTITSLDGKDLSNVYVTQNGATVPVVLSADLKSISFQTQELTNSIVFGLEAGKYELKETVTPVAYLRAESIVFEISDNGNVINTATNVQGSPIVMIDEADPTYSTSGTTTSVAFSKQSMTNLGTELVGATMKITTTNLSIDLSGVSYTGGDTVIRTTSMITWNTSETVFEVDLPDGTYTLEEVVAPDGYAVITTTTFTVSGGVVTKTSSNTDVEIIGTYVTAFDEAYTGPSTLVAGASRVPPTTVENLNEAVEKASVVANASRKIPATGDSMAMTDIAAIVLLAAAAVTIGTVAVKTKKEAR